MTLRPAPADSGVVFLRTDLKARGFGDGALVRASYDTVSDVTMCTVLGNEAGARIVTVEHLLAAFAGCGIDNILVELDGEEIPAMDGSSWPFVFLIECADVVAQAAERRYIRILKEVAVQEGSKRAALSPGDGFAVGFEIDFDNPLIGRQECFFNLHNGTFKREIARARTFGFASEVDQLKRLGLARGGSLKNAVVVADDRILNEEGLRFANEFVRHKALDSIGDLYLAGAPFIGRFHGVRSGHAMNNKLLHALFADSDAWCYTTDEPSRALTGGANWPAKRVAAPA
jgi:UDP-3-O-[3-hydroxymyristoyl] N-acetylglucosamine deacetylase